MIPATSGVPVTLLAQFVSDGAAAEPELPLTLTIVPSTGGDAVLITDELANPSLGVYTYAWTPPAVDEKTDYLATFDPSGDDVAAIEVVSVFPASLLSWANVAEVNAITGKTVSPETVSLASSMISTISGAYPEMPADSIIGMDRVHLRRATAWQAIWIPTKPGITTDRENVQSVSSDSQSIVREDRIDAILAPLARRELVALSWIGTRTELVIPLNRRFENQNFLNEKSDPDWFGS